jgi:signal transduction histidine kinase
MLGNSAAPYLAAFVLAAAGCFWGAYRARSFETPVIRRPLTLLLALTGVWGLATVPLLLPVPEAVMYASYFLGLGVGISTVVVWLWFCSAYAGHTYHLDRRLQLVAAGLVGAILTLKATNPLHRAYFEPTVATDPFVHFAPEVGALYWTITALAYVGSGVGLYLLFETYHESALETRNVAVLTLAIGLPVVPKLLSTWWPESLLLLYYEPIGAAVFAVGVVTVARERFVAVHVPARRQLPDQLPDLVFLTDADGRIVDYNESAECVFPDLPERVGDPFSAIAPRVADAEDATVELDRDGDPRCYRIDRRRITLGDETVGHATVLSDVTELEAQRRNLRRQTEHVREVSEAVAHELRNPIAILLGNLRVVEEQRADDAGAPDAGDASGGPLRAAIEAAERIDVVTDDFIDILRYGTPITETSERPLEAVLANAWPGDTAALTLEGVGEASVVADGTRCAELFRLLFRLHRERGATTVRVRRDGADALVVDSDGEPFSTDTPEQLFKYGREAGEGSRVLLANAWTLATLHGWSIAAPEGDRLSIRLTDVSLR